MKESALWDHLKPELQALGKFQKVSDRYTPGVPDVLGCFASRGIAIELKELKGVRVIKAKFRPGQLDWLEDWDKAGGFSWIVSTWGYLVFVHSWEHGSGLEIGMTSEKLKETALLWELRRPSFRWSVFVNFLLQHVTSRIKLK